MEKIKKILVKMISVGIVYAVVYFTIAWAGVAYFRECYPKDEADQKIQKFVVLLVCVFLGLFIIKMRFFLKPSKANWNHCVVVS